MIHDDFEDYLVSERDWSPEEVWQARDRESKPHVLVTQAQALTGENDELLRSELLTLVAVMISRLEDENFQRHEIIPVGSSLSGFSNLY